MFLSIDSDVIGPKPPYISLFVITAAAISLIWVKYVDHDVLISKRSEATADLGLHFDGCDEKSSPVFFSILCCG